MRDASKPAVSWLKIEPRVSIFLVIKSAVAVFITSTTMESPTCWMCIYGSAFRI